MKWPDRIDVGADVALKRLTLDDAEELFALIDRNRAHLSQFGERTSAKYPTISSLVESIRHPPDPVKLRMCIQASGEIVGSINLMPYHSAMTPYCRAHIPPFDADPPFIAEIGYYLGAEHGGRGYMSQAVGVLTSYAFQYGFDELFATIHPENIPSIRVVERNGYRETLALSDKKTFLKLKEEHKRRKSSSG